MLIEPYSINLQNSYENNVTGQWDKSVKAFAFPINRAPVIQLQYCYYHECSAARDVVGRAFSTGVALQRVGSDKGVRGETRECGRIQKQRRCEIPFHRINFHFESSKKAANKIYNGKCLSAFLNNRCLPQKPKFFQS